jgi:hypothetical protein
MNWQMLTTDLLLDTVADDADLDLGGDGFEPPYHELEDDDELDAAIEREAARLGISLPPREVNA